MAKVYGQMLIIFILAALLAGCSLRQDYETSANLSRPLSGAININTATVEELDELPHIGRKTAEAIVRFRTDNGPFRRTEYLMQIRGISEKRFLEIRDSVRTE